MPIDAMILNPMLDPFKNMAQECADKGMSGPHYDEMMDALSRMEQLGQEHSDFMAFSTQMTTEGLQLNFSNAYGRLLTEEASQAGQAVTSNDPEEQDKALLAQNIQALRGSILELKRGKEEAKKEADKHHTDASLTHNEIDVLFKSDLLISPIEALIEYGESGVNFPTFLRVQIEKGLDKAMEGSLANKEMLDYALDAEQAVATSPFLIRIREEEKEAFHAISAQSKLGIPDAFHVELSSNRISRTYEKEQAHWSQYTQWWSGLFDTMDTWVLAQTKFAPGIQPWSMAGSPSAIKEAIRFSIHTIPPTLRVRFDQFQARFNTSFSEIMKEASFQWAVDYCHFSYAERYTHFLLNHVFNALMENRLLTPIEIEEANDFYSSQHMANPDTYKVSQRQKAFIDRYFGDGHAESKFGQFPNSPVSKAPSWAKFNS